LWLLFSGNKNLPFCLLLCYNKNISEKNNALIGNTLEIGKAEFQAGGFAAWFQRIIGFFGTVFDYTIKEDV